MNISAEDINCYLTNALEIFEDNAIKISAKFSKSQAVKLYFKEGTNASRI